MAKAKTRKSKTGSYPDKAAVLEFIRESPTPVGKREIARAFRLRGGDRVRLEAMLKELHDDGLLARREKRKATRATRLPAVMVVEVSGMDEDGELLARPALWDRDEAPPVIYLAPEKRSRAALAPGDRALAKLERIDARTYEGRPIRKIGRLPRRVLGVYDPETGDGRLHPTDRRARADFILRPEDSRGAKPGELVLAEVRPGPARRGLRQARVVDRLGDASNPRALSLIAITEHDLPVDFAPEALAEARAAGPVPLGRRSDLRGLPLVTIDGADARDFDDAVWAEPDARSPGGWHILVAIADVACYVPPGGPLDRAAFERGNSAYFPDRVVPMLPEALSNGWCSLRPGEDRPCLAVELWIDAEGKARRYRFLRGLMRSAARLTYAQVQAGHDGRPDAATEALLETVIAPLYGAYRALLAARARRGTLDLELPERRVVIDESGKVAAIEPRKRLDSHRLIEEFMIAANVAAAKQLEALRQPCMYRVHDQPDPVKVEALRQILDPLGLRLARGQVIRPRVFTRILEQVAGGPKAAMVNELILRAQSQAAYSPENIGHFGLALTHYVHFTSPIRRYADLLVHRALIRGLGLGEGGLPPEAGARFEEIGGHISRTERRAAGAERDALDRLAAAFLQDRLGAVLRGRISSVTRFGLFVTLDETGADGLVPMSTLPDDAYDHVAAQHCLVGRRWGRVYRLGERVSVRLREADPTTGGIVLEPIEAAAAEHHRRDGITAGPGPEPAGGDWHPLGPERSDPDRPARAGKARASAKAGTRKVKPASGQGPPGKSRPKASGRGARRR
ncbi:MAG: ribonuclease R [Kiloniellaceae bacterium]